MHEMPSSEEVLMHVRAAGAEDRFHVTRLVNERLRDRGLTMRDVRHALIGARLCMDRGDDTFRIAGTDLDGAPLSLIVTVEDGSVVVIAEDER
jgi:hypothetical protein